MKRKLLVIMMAAMMLSVTACGQNTSVVNDSQGQEISDTGAEDSSNESSSEVDYDTTDMELYTDKEGNDYYYDINCVPDWWEGKVEISEQGGTKYLVCLVEDPDWVIIFMESSTSRVGDSEGSYHDYVIKKYVPEGWEIDYSKSTSFVKYLRNKDLDVEVEVHVNASIDTDMYNYDRKEQKTCWNIGNSGNIKYVYEKPENIEYTVQTYEQYKGAAYENGEQYLFVRTYPDGRVYYDSFDEDALDIMLSITEEDAQKMQNAGLYTDINEQFDGLAFIKETDSDFALFSYLYLNDAGYLNPDADFYWKKRVN